MRHRDRSPTKKTTVHFDPAVHCALRLKAAETERNISSLVNEAVRAALSEDVDDLEAFELRENEPDHAFEEVVRDLRRRSQV